MITVTDLFVYPIKSCQGIKLSQAQVTTQGLLEDHKVALRDRTFMLVDSQGNFLTQREYPLLATIQVKFDDEFSVITLHNSLSSVTFSPTLNGKEIKVKIWGDRTTAIDQGDEVAHWFNQVLQLSGNSKCRLVKQSPKYIRPIDAKYSLKPNQPVSFADGYPFLLTATASLEDLNNRLEAKYPNQNQAIPMNRFRPNIVVQTNQPFIESGWEKIKIGEVEFNLVKSCSRCIITTTNQETGERNQLKEPLLMLTSFRQFKNKGVMFGENMIPNPENLGIIKIGDIVEIIYNKERMG